MHKIFITIISLSSLLLALQTKTYSGQELEITFKNLYDNTIQSAVLYKPNSIDKRKDVPLLIHMHYLLGTRYTARDLKYYSQADKYNWYILSPELHGKNTEGGKTSWSSLEAQHDVIDSLNYVLKKYSNIDKSRIYLAGRSMGGMLSLLIGSKYPDLFAAVVSGQPITDTKLFLETSELLKQNTHRKPFLTEMGGKPSEVPFEYKRRSSYSFARNLAYIPVNIWVGTEDYVIVPKTVERMYIEMKKYNKFHYPINWLVGAPHCPMNYTAAWVIEKLKYHQNLSDGCLGFKAKQRYYPKLNLITDESKSFFYFDLVMKNKNTFAEINSEVLNDKITIITKNLKQLTIDLLGAAGYNKDLPKGGSIKQFDIKCDNNLTVIFKLKDKVLVIKNIKKKAKGSII